MLTRSSLRISNPMRYTGSYFYVVGEAFGGKCDGLIGRGFDTFPIKDLIILHRREGLHLCEHKSTI